MGRTIGELTTRRRRCRLGRRDPTMSMALLSPSPAAPMAMVAPARPPPLPLSRPHHQAGLPSEPLLNPPEMETKREADSAEESHGGDET